MSEFEYSKIEIAKYSSNAAYIFKLKVLKWEKLYFVLNIPKKLC